MKNDAGYTSPGADISRQESTQNSSSCRLPRPRDGRALVECIVAIFLLATVSLASAVTTNGSLALADDSQLVARAQALAVSRVEDALTSPCATSGSGTDQLPRVNVLWQQSGAAASTSVQLDISVSRSPIAINGLSFMQLALMGGGVCP